ncbi:MAG: hypothetical protein ACRD8A_08815 [Candidatus Acidiferrales bacterium]
MKKKRKLRVGYTIEVETETDHAAISAALSSVPSAAQYSSVNIIGTWLPAEVPMRPKVGERTNGVGA